MELKDKLIEDRDAAHAESQQREELDQQQEELPAPIVEAIQDQDRERRAQLLGAIRMILGHQHLEIGQLRMPPREARALTALQAAVEGKSSDLNSFVYAEDRRDLLERALGVLQPDLTHTDDKSAHELHAQLGDLSERLGELRHRLSSLEDAQDELISVAPEVAAIVGEPGDKPKPTAKPSDPDAPRPATTLTGPDLPAPKPAPTTLTGPEVPARKPAPTTLVGPEVPERKPAPSTLVGPELPEPEPPPASTLASDASAADDAMAADPAVKGKRPWWRRPFG
ncbi:MAG TPA: hypothetical protein VK601_17800 [Kofleriaceae bacterium]|nr:hypothetical protein [Kofleriaceae bacterium]